MNGKISIAVAGLGFGSAFVPIYRRHPDVGAVGLYDTDGEKLDGCMKRYGCDRAYRSFGELLSDRSVDAVHLVTPIPLHEEQTLAVLRSGKHCACTVPMAITLEGLRRIVDLVGETGKNYMMMETAVYTRHFLHAEGMRRRGEFGRIQFLRGAHYQDMENWPPYWMGLPPMYYGTHAIAPLVMLAGERIARTHCFGSGAMREELRRPYGNPYPLECAIFEFENGLKAEATRSLFAVARGYTESFSVYGERSTFEWQQLEDEEDPVLFTMGGLQRDERGEFLRGTGVSARRFAPADRAELLPPEIRDYTLSKTRYDATNPQLSFEEGGGHGGSHPHLAHEFVRSVVEGRKPLIHERVAANVTAAGICAHASAMAGGGEVAVPDFA